MIDWWLKIETKWDHTNTELAWDLVAKSSRANGLFNHEACFEFTCNLKSQFGSYSKCEKWWWQGIQRRLSA